MSLSAVNPVFASGMTSEKPPTEQKSNWRSVGKLLAVLGTVAVVGGVGFLVGNSSSSDGDGSAASGTDATDSATAARAELTSAFLAVTNVAFSDSLTIEVLNDVVAQYEANPLGYSDAFFSKELIQSLITLRDSEADTERRELRGDVQRRLQETSADIAAFAVVDNADYSNAIQTASGEDRAEVIIQGSTCYIVAEESGSGADWSANLRTGSANILSVRSYTVTDEDQCGCAREQWWWCAEANTCEARAVLGSGYRGFTEAFNEMSQALWARVQSSGCLNRNSIVITGYSRGASIMSNFAFVVLQEQLIPLNKLSMVTFGSPRALSDTASDALHLRFPQRRLVYRNDIVVGLPFGWMGVKHFGQLVCNECGYSGRDAPSFPNLGGSADHTSYDQWL